MGGLQTFRLTLFSEARLLTPLTFDCQPVYCIAKTHVLS
jgi:hypothetical protein